MRKFASTAIAVAIGIALSNSALAQALSKNDYKAGMDRIAAEYKTDKSNCSSFSGNANDVCMAEASGKEHIAKADLEARDKDTNDARYRALIVKAEADYAVAKEKCDDKAGNLKDVCVKEAKAAETTAKADAKSQMKVSDAKNKADRETNGARSEENHTSVDARRDADMAKRDANYAVAKEKCESLAGDAKDGCMNDAKTLHDKI